MTFTHSRRDFFLGLGGAAVLGATATGFAGGCTTEDTASVQDPIWSDASQTSAVSVSLPNGAQISGTCAPAWRPVLDAFVANFRDRNEIGASLALTIQGKPIVDVWGGFSDTLAATPSKPWTRDTVSLVFSCTKAATALCAHHLIGQGLLDLDKPVAFYWPEFAQAGKSAVTVRMLMAHAAGLAAIPFTTPVRPDGWADFEYMAGLLAATTPWWQPGTTNGYHALTYGWLVGEVVKRVSGLSLGTYFASQIAGPLGMDFWIGLPDAVLPRVSPMLAATEVAPNDPFSAAIAADPTSLQAAAFFNLGGWFGVPPSSPPEYNTTASLKAEIGAAGGVTNARGLATMYAALANGGALGKVRLLPEAYAAQLGVIRAATFLDHTLLVSTRFGLGVHGAIDNRTIGPGQSVILGPHAFGHGGFGGSLGFADPSSQLSFGYTMNRMGAGAGLNDRGQSLVDATYGVLGATTNQFGVWV